MRLNGEELCRAVDRVSKKSAELGAPATALPNGQIAAARREHELSRVQPKLRWRKREPAGAFRQCAIDQEVLGSQ
jgi:hypothetical protein